ncbi:hypothetical protein MGN70_000643 [Eutypa lata]|nr:hypothetical protein MGN70_000643 [Eutypa lata]
MACNNSSHSTLVNRNGPGSAASSTFESIVKPAEATGGKTRCIDCGDYDAFYFLSMTVYFEEDEKEMDEWMGFPKHDDGRENHNIHNPHSICKQRVG